MTNPKIPNRIFLPKIHNLTVIIRNSLKQFLDFPPPQPPQLWGEYITFLSSKSPRIGGLGGDLQNYEFNLDVV
ncbi:MAG: hypothetical protein DCF12_19400 [Snowella sp.]|nr:MAG: hypothetical protein DCF12_19400 [Snowella sp.]